MVRYFDAIMVGKGTLLCWSTLLFRSWVALLFMTLILLDDPTFSVNPIHTKK